MYGAAVEVRYLDVSEPSVRDAQRDILEALAEEDLPLPAVFLDGRLLYAGSINPLRVVAAVAEEWQRRNHE